MIKHLKYLKYMIKHKWYVFKACMACGLYWRGIIHDWSKFLPSEWFPYVNHFYGKKTVPNRESDQPYKLAWLLHQKRNKHHWQWWVLPKDQGGLECLPMPNTYRKEMLCDWIGAGMAITGKLDIGEWYLKQRTKIKLHPETRAWIENEISAIDKEFAKIIAHERVHKNPVVTMKEKNFWGYHKYNYDYFKMLFDLLGGNPTIENDEKEIWLEEYGLNFYQVKFPNGRLEYIPIVHYHEYMTHKTIQF